MPKNWNHQRIHMSNLAWTLLFCGTVNSWEMQLTPSLHSRAAAPEFYYYWRDNATTWN